jgi:hypothetical protein
MLAFGLAKAADILLVSFYYIVFGLVASIILQILTRLYEEKTSSADPKPIVRVVFEIGTTIAFVVVAFWIIRNVVEAIPSPVEGVGGYIHARLSTQTTSQIAALTLLIFQSTLLHKVSDLNDRIFKNIEDRK